MFTARTTRVSNPFCSPGLRPSLSNPFWYGAFATGSPLRIITFYRSPQNTPYSSRFLEMQFLLPASKLSLEISQKTCKSSYERFRPNKNDCHLWRWCYRGCWHQSSPPLILQVIYTWQKPTQSVSTLDPLITLACIVKVPRLLHPVGLGSVSQYPSPGYHSHGPYRS